MFIMSIYMINVGGALIFFTYHISFGYKEENMVLLSPSKLVWVKKWEAPARGHPSRTPSVIFCDCFNYIAQILSQYPNVFPKYLRSIESSVNSKNTAARGQTRHVPLHSTIMHFCDDRDGTWELHHAKTIQKSMRSRHHVLHHQKMVQFYITTMKTSSQTISTTTNSFSSI